MKSFIICQARYEKNTLGGGEGKSPIGMPSPVTPWGKPTLGKKTRKNKKYSNEFILRRRISSK